jgi:RNA 3'-terminal phosphate cyclase
MNLLFTLGLGITLWESMFHFMLGQKEASEERQTEEQVGEVRGQTLEEEKMFVESSFKRLD